MVASTSLPEQTTVALKLNVLGLQWSKQKLDYYGQESWIIIFINIHLDILVYTGMYIPGRTMLMYLDVFACIRMYQYIMRGTYLYPLVRVSTSMYFE